MAQQEHAQSFGAEGELETGRDVRLALSVAPSFLSGRATVLRARVLREINLRAHDACATVIEAPDGFGKTTLIAQRAAEVQADPERGIVRLIDASGLDGEQVYELFGEIEARLEGSDRPLVAIDNLPVLHEMAIEGIAARIRELHAKGFEFMLACKPNNRRFVNSLGDAYKITPQSLAVRPREYSEWVRQLGIPGELDVYGLTQGVPGLVSLLGLVDGRPVNLETYAAAAVQIYDSVLEDMKRDRDSLYRLACIMVLSGAGSLRDFERIKMRIHAQTWARVAREYPVFGVDVERGTYHCLVHHSGAMGELCKRIVCARPLFAMRAIELLMAIGDVDRAVYVARMLESPGDRVEVLAGYPTRFALSGNIEFVRELVGVVADATSSTTPAGAVLGMYLAALVSGDLRVARALAVEIRRRERDLIEAIDPDAWVEAKALSALWSNCRGVGLPDLDAGFTQGRVTAASAALSRHRSLYRGLLDGEGVVSIGAAEREEDGLADEGVSIPAVLLACDRAMVDAFTGDTGDVRALDAKLQRMTTRLLKRRLTPIATHVRMVAALCRLLSGMPVADERAFVDAGTLSVRTSDFSTQLFCLVGEGWQSLEVGQHANALFRARQVLKLADEGQRLVVSWARMLECCTHVLNTSRRALEEEAELLDLTESASTPVDAWVVALGLAGARRVSELGAWCSMNRARLCSSDFGVLARQAMMALGDRVCDMKRVLPEAYRAMGDEAIAVPGRMPYVEVQGEMGAADILMGQVSVNLFGGFQVERGGHVVTDAMWRRRKACVIAARLVLAGGSFVGRKEIGDEVWPDKDYLHAREAMYSGLTALRSAFGQCETGPQYVLTQGDGVAINTEYVGSDTMHFEVLARDILLGRSGTAGRQLIDACLKLDEAYTGPLYVPNDGDTSFFARQRQVYQTKFVDCMMKGIEVALELDDLSVASWLVEAARKQAPLREDVIRAAMRIYDKSGRRREIVELYGAHAHLVEQQLHSLPEKETQLAYEAIMKRGGGEVLLG